MITSQSRPARREGILAENVSGTQLLLNLSNGQYFALNDVGSRVWELCDGRQSVSDIITTVGEEYDAPHEVIEADVLELLGSLADEKLVVAHT